MAFIFEKSGKLKILSEAELAAADAHSNVIVLDRGVAEDCRPYWLYIAVKPSKYKEFMRLTSQRLPKRFEDFGTILRYGFEEDVPPAIKVEMKQKYGCDDNYMDKLAKDVKTEQVKFIKQQEDKKIGDIVAMLKMKKPLPN